MEQRLFFRFLYDEIVSCSCRSSNCPLFRHDTGFVRTVQLSLASLIHQIINRIQDRFNVDVRDPMCGRGQYTVGNGVWVESFDMIEIGTVESCYRDAVARSHMNQGGVRRNQNL